MISRLQLPCGCVIEADHPKGDRMTRCAGGGIPRENHVSDRTVCPGGLRYAITAERVETVLYSARRLP